MEYSVVIRCYNEEKYIGRLLSGVLSQTLQPREIVVVDSGSTDATLSMVSRFPVRIVNLRKDNFSFGRSLNLGCAATSAPFLLIASAHVYPVYSNWAECLLKPFANEKIGLVYGRQKGGEASYFAEHQIFRKWFPELSSEEQFHPFCNNANAAIRRKLWEGIPYSEELTGLEDLDWAKKIIQRGFKLAYQAGAEVVHIHNEDYDQIFNRYYREALALKQIYPGEKFGKREFTFLLLSNIFLDIMHAVKEGKLSENLKHIVMFRLMQFSGTYRGFMNEKGNISYLRERLYYPQIKRSSVSEKQVNERNKIDYSMIGDGNG